jgi:hypothetical protein
MSKHQSLAIIVEEMDQTGYKASAISDPAMVAPATCITNKLPSLGHFTSAPSDQK